MAREVQLVESPEDDVVHLHGVRGSEGGPAQQCKESFTTKLSKGTLHHQIYMATCLLLLPTATTYQ
jgi:hypothetical protein